MISEEEAEEDETESQKEEGPNKVTSEWRDRSHFYMGVCGAVGGSLNYCHMALIGQQKTAEISQAQRPKCPQGHNPLEALGKTPPCLIQLLLALASLGLRVQKSRLDSHCHFPYPGKD